MITFISFAFLSCGPYAVPHRIKREFYCYNGGKSTGIDSLINITGYYSKLNYREMTIGGDTYHIKTNYFFFNDGIFIVDGNSVKDSPSQYLSTVAGYSRYTYGGSFNCGIYKISHDTVKAQILEPGSANTYHADEHWFTIINQTAIKEIYTKAVGIYPRISEEYYDGDTLFFVKASDTLPVSNAWLKKKKWFWCKDAWEKRKQAR